MRIKAEQAVALVVDYQEKLVPVMSDKEKVVRNSVILLSGLRALEVPICITQQYTKGLGTTINKITEAIGTTQYIDKIAFSAYSSVKDFIAAKKFVIICGIEAHICVLQTVIDLKENGYIPVLVEDCIDSRNKHDKKIGIERARAEGAIITTYESLLFELLQRAGSDKSKKIQKLVK
ncbi:MAG: isochorismatase family protein [Lachnospiraceae bacterium]